MKFSGSIGVMIIIISFLGCSFISAVNITPTTNEEINYEFKNTNIIKNQESYKISEFQNYSIPNDNKQYIPLVNNNDVSLSSGVTPLKKFLNSLNYSDNCELITVKIDLKTEPLKKYSIEYPVTPFLCAEGAGKWLRPIELGNITFNYKIGDSVIYLVNSNNSLSIDKTFIAHHQDQLALMNKGINPEFLSIKSSDIIQWREKCLNTIMTDPIINIKEINPNIQYCKINLSNFTTYGNEITINGQLFQIFNKQILVDSKLYDLCDIDILYNYNKCSLIFNDINIDHDLGLINDHKITFKGDWDFIAQYYEGHSIKNTEYKWNMNPFDIFQINNSYIVAFLGTVIILSGICAYTIGLNFIDWAVIISIITFILIAWKI